MSMSTVIDHDRRSASYAELIARVRGLVQSSTPEGATVAVVSRGDGELLKLVGRIGWHFPRTEGGQYAGHHPADDADAIARLERTRHDGARFLVLPATSSWWLEHYAGLARHLDSRYRRVAAQAEVAIVFSLEGRVAEPDVALHPDHEMLLANVRSVAAALLPAGAEVLVAVEDDDRIIDLGGPVGRHFRLDDGARAIAQIEARRTTGAEYILIPRTSQWWLERHSALRTYLQTRFSLVTRQENVCSIYDLRVTRKEPKPRRRRKHA